MATQASLLRRLRKLIDDAGSGYSQSAPGFSTDLTESTVTTPYAGVQIDGDVTARQVALGALAGLSTGNAIAYRLQTAIRAILPLVSGYANCSIMFDPAEGYIIRSGTFGSASEVHFLVPTVGANDITSELKLGLHNGGFESSAKVDWTDDDLEEMLDMALATENASGIPSSWTYSTLPSGYETVVVYRGWANVVDVMLGRAAHNYPQKVDAEEVSANVIFDSLFKLAKWLRDKIADLEGALDGLIEVETVSRFDMRTQTYIGDASYKDGENTPRLLSVSAGPDAGTAIIEFAEILTPGAKTAYIGHKDAVGVIDRTVFTAVGADGDETGFEGSTLDRTITNLKNTLVKVAGLAPDTYYFAMMVVDENGNRYFSNEVTVTIP